MNRNTGMIAGILAAVTLFGCAKEPSYLKAESKEDNTIEAVAVNAANGSESNADITIGENELAVVDVDMTTGQIQVVFEKEGSGKAAVDYTFYTDGTTEYELEPGEYSVTFSIPEKTNGTIKIS